VNLIERWLRFLRNGFDMTPNNLILMETKIGDAEPVKPAYTQIRLASLSSRAEELRYRCLSVH